ncbi:alpha/beta hydrolase [Kribbia dieselivorans]|uniref:alpha/beta hydrolase n=1 Tax=Kribbia dieselivorans TaxID=331526 RepID=UPI0008385B11|nr:alpha/beta hydrolase [Kribbia dieselivorans]
MLRVPLRLSAMAVAGALTASLAVAASAPTAHADAAVAGTTAVSAPSSEATKTDRVATSVKWGTCPKPRRGLPTTPPNMQCGTVKVPLDYDVVGGKQINLHVTRVPARKPSQRLGSLFINPGGPGAPGSDMASDLAMLVDDATRDRFDLIGFDPRGVGRSTPLRCFTSTAAQLKVTAGLTKLPRTATQRASYNASARAYAKACSTTGKEMASAMSTAEVARDLDVLRRVFGDEQLTYLGFSYGTYLGQVYANMFPDRIRAMALDGVLDPQAWRGTAATRTTPVTLRLGSDVGTHKAVQEGLRLCRQAGRAYCLGYSVPRKHYDEAVAQLKRRPVTVTYENFGFLVDYEMFMNTVTMASYDASAPEAIAWVVEDVYRAIKKKQKASATADAAPYRVSRQTGELLKRARTSGTPQYSPFDVPTVPLPGASKDLAGYNQGTDAFYATLCTDSLNPTNSGTWRHAVDAAAANSADYAGVWGWQSMVCAGTNWKAVDEDAWTGPFTAQTSAPILLIGNTYDPATPFSGAQAARRLLPNSALLKVNEFGHTATYTNRCAGAKVEEYLRTAQTPTGLSCARETRLFRTRVR